MATKVNDLDEKKHLDYSIEVRLALLVQCKLQNKNDWKRLEELTGVKSVKWRHLHAGVIKQPSVDMIEALCKLYPQHAFWLTTGLTDYEAGHTAPEIHLAFPGTLESGLGNLPGQQEATVRYFKECLEILGTCWQEWMDYVQKNSKVEMDRNSVVDLYKPGINTSLQLRATEFTNALGKRWQMGLVNRLAKSRNHHLDSMISRLRENFDDADTVIDRQRAFEAELIAEFEKKDQQNVEIKKRK
ncbi:hypothetical protein PT7_0596 [Pusillimonas sp. T7-7]|uniref:hypothetical protein n=1 Tax=Pusillimonas sp. (strain T7-7) TaxID=1007105 RepID=UPI0002085672|nr:hypothetical protein [Pusillimonas sp. T7-7]AEC19136.1 hypothetical protein PT7_0596 [Pusillimonas sp. T7-7]